MMTSADIIVDTEGRPILVLPSKLSEGETILKIKDDSFQIDVNGQTEVEMNNVADEYLIAMGLHKKIGISVQEAENKIPDTIHYVADVEQHFSK